MTTPPSDERVRELQADKDRVIFAWSTGSSDPMGAVRDISECLDELLALRAEVQRLRRIKAAARKAVEGCQAEAENSWSPSETIDRLSQRLVDLLMVLVEEKHPTTPEPNA